VVEGNKIGRTLGYPTANLQLEDQDETVPGQGVYTAMVSLGDKWYESMVNIGIRPTLDLYHVTIEAHLFGFHGDIYGEAITIHFLERIRDEMRFSSLSELKKQLDTDRVKSQKALARLLPELEKRGGELVLKQA
jgi:riboflavin kinase / FMN adenylyltransferase